MPITHWAVTNIEGEMVGQYCQIKVSSRMDSYENFVSQEGYIKILLSHTEYEKLSFSFNKERKIYEKHINPATSRAKELPAAKKAINEAKAKPNKYRERIDANGNLVKEFYDKDGNLERTEIEPGE